MPTLILGSQSPRRAELLSLADLDFTVEVAGIAEDVPAGMPADQIPLYLAKLKAEAILKQTTENAPIILTADTIVVCNDKVLGKPQNKAEAQLMLESLSGKKHQVITGVYIHSAHQSASYTARVNVAFHKLSTSEITYYIEKYAPMDKAGAYAIQEWIGAIGIASIEGDYYSVMGLPISWVYQTLKNEFGWCI